MNLISLIPYGRTNAISRSELATLTNMSDRKVRKAVRSVRKKWVAIEPFICSDSKESGYWLTSETEEIRDVRNWLYSYIEAIFGVLINMDKQLAVLDGTGLVYVRPHYRRVGKGQCNGRSQMD